MCVYNTSTSPLECEHCYFIIFPGYSIGLVTSDKNNQWLLKSFSFIQKTKTMTSSPTASWQTDGEKVETVTDLIFLGFKIMSDDDCSYGIQRCLLLGRKTMTNLVPLLLSRFSRVWLCDTIDCSPPGFAIPGILQARTLEWVAISFSNAWKWKVKVKVLSHVLLFATPWTMAYQAPPSMGFSRQEYWSGVSLPSPNDKPRQYIKK